jgi:hypothetical protein
MSVGRLGVWPIVLGGLGLVVVLAGCCAGWVGAGLPYQRAVMFTLAVTGLGAFVACMAGTLGPMLTLPPVSQW